MSKRIFSALLALTLLLSTPALAGSSMPDARVGEGYSYELWSRLALGASCWLTEGTVPGLSIESGEGMGRYFTYSGTPTQAGTYYLSFSVDDGDGFAETANYQLTVYPAYSTTTLAITTSSLPEAVVGQSYSAYLKAEGTSPIEFGVYYNPGHANEFDATGLSLDTDGRLSGTPHNVGQFTFSVCASDATGEAYKNFTLRVRSAESGASEGSGVSTGGGTVAQAVNGIRRGASGEDVRRIQSRLALLGFLNDTVDGIFGGKTEQAVKDFQAAVGFAQSGVADDLTQDRLYDDFNVMTKEIAVRDAQIRALEEATSSETSRIGAYQFALATWRELSVSLKAELSALLSAESGAQTRFLSGTGLYESGAEQIVSATGEQLSAMNLNAAVARQQANQYRLYCLSLSALLLEFKTAGN